MTIIYLGLAVVGIGLVFKVFKEGLDELNALHQKGTQFREGTELYRNEAAEEEIKARELQELVEEAKLEAKNLAEKEKLFTRKISALKKKLNRSVRSKHAIDPFGPS